LATVVAQHDVDEAIRRLGTLQLAAGLTRVSKKLSYSSAKDPGPAGAKFFRHASARRSHRGGSRGSGAPQLTISIMQQLLLLALDPYFARVLGIYFVDTEIQPGVEYDYCVTGYWGPTSCQVGALSRACLWRAARARSAAFAGMKSLLGAVRRFGVGCETIATEIICPGPIRVRHSVLPPPRLPRSAASLWLRNPKPCSRRAVSDRVSPPAETPVVQIALPHGAMRVNLRVSGQGSVNGLAAGVTVATAAFNSTQLASHDSQCTKLRHAPRRHRRNRPCEHLG